MEVTEDFFQRKGMLRAQGQHDCFVSRRGLQFEVERTAKALAQSESPRAIDANPERGMDHQLHAAGFIKEPLHHQRVLRWNDPERSVNGAEIVCDLGGCSV